MLKEAGLEPLVQSKSGLPLDPYFSASKMGWIINNVVGAKTLADKNKLRIGTMDAFFSTGYVAYLSPTITRHLELHYSIFIR